MPIEQCSDRTGPVELVTCWRAVGPMNVISVNVGLPREVEWQGERVLTSIYKYPVEGRLHVKRLNIEGDRQADLTVHGGAEKAVYVYPSEHYAYWRDQLPGVDLPWGAFGENLTTGGLDEQMRIGDRLRIGSADFVVTQPRMPCFKLGIRFGTMNMVKRFLQSGRSGFYLAVTGEGEIGAGDTVTMTAAAAGPTVTVAEIVSLYASHGRDRQLLGRASEAAALPEDWRDYFRQQLRKA
jgi:MOSC domain-containing protein YiiM